MTQPLLPTLQNTAVSLIGEFHQIQPVRKELLNQLTDFIRTKTFEAKPVYLNFICTHNSRRSHISQLWAQAAAHYYGISNVTCLAGGTEATAFNPRAVKAMQEAGFNISIKKDGENPLYEVRFADNALPVLAFSKTYDNPFNHNQDFAAVMTCSHADTNCPMVIGASKRIALTFYDPKEFDGTPLESAKYDERVREIGREILYAFSQV